MCLPLYNKKDGNLQIPCGNAMGKIAAGSGGPPGPSVFGKRKKKSQRLSREKRGLIKRLRQVTARWGLCGSSRSPQVAGLYRIWTKSDPAVIQRGRGSCFGRDYRYRQCFLSLSLLFFFGWFPHFPLFSPLLLPPLSLIYLYFKISSTDKLKGLPKTLQIPCLFFTFFFVLPM